MFSCQSTRNKRQLTSVCRTGAPPFNLVSKLSAVAADLPATAAPVHSRCPRHAAPHGSTRAGSLQGIGGRSVGGGWGSRAAHASMPVPTRRTQGQAVEVDVVSGALGIEEAEVQGHPVVQPDPLRRQVLVRRRLERIARRRRHPHQRGAGGHLNRETGLKGRVRGGPPAVRCRDRHPLRRPPGS